MTMLCFYYYLPNCNIIDKIKIIALVKHDEVIGASRYFTTGSSRLKFAKGVTDLILGAFDGSF